MALIYKKTAKGSEEVTTRKCKLAPKYRSALITVDGRKTDELLIATWNLLGDGYEILHTLLQDGFIEHDTLAVVPSILPREQSPDTGITDISMTQPIPRSGDAAKSVSDCKQAAAQFLYDTLGPEADTLALRIEQANNLTALTVALDRARTVLADFNGREKSDEFWALVTKHIAG